MLYQSKETLRITDGPSRLELYVAGAFAFDERNFHHVRFQADGEEFEARITSIVTNDGTIYDIVGSIVESKYYRGPGSLIHTRDNFTGRYTPKRRTGIMTRTILKADDKPSLTP